MYTFFQVFLHILFFTAVNPPPPCIILYRTQNKIKEHYAGKIRSLVQFAGTMWNIFTPSFVFSSSFHLFLSINLSIDPVFVHESFFVFSAFLFFLYFFFVCFYFCTSVFPLGCSSLTGSCHFLSSGD